jgi:hypothetical protein
MLLLSRTPKFPNFRTFIRLYRTISCRIVKDKKDKERLKTHKFKIIYIKIIFQRAILIYFVVIHLECEIADLRLSLSPKNPFYVLYVPFGQILDSNLQNYPTIRNF